MVNNISIQIPQNIKIIYWVKNINNKKIFNLTLLNDNKKFVLNLNYKKNLLRFDKNTNSFLIEKNSAISYNKTVKFFLVF